MIPTEIMERANLLVETCQRLRKQIEVDLYCIDKRENGEDVTGLEEDIRVKKELCKKYEEEMMSIIIDQKQQGHIFAFLLNN